MMLSKRYYITLNPSKKKDKIILDFLKSNYSESETIKNLLYLYAVQGNNKMQLGAEIMNINNLEIEQKGEKSTKEEQMTDNFNKVNIEINEDIKNMF